MLRLVNRDHETGCVVISVVPLPFLKTFTNEKSGNALVRQSYTVVVGSNKVKQSITIFHFITSLFILKVMYKNPV